MKKNLIFSLLFLLLFVCLPAQKPSSQIIEKFKKATDDRSKESDLIINPGVPVFIIVNIEHSTPNDSLLADREIKELQKNFGGNKSIFLTKFNNGTITFNNFEKKKLDFSEFNESHKMFVYWDGKPKSSIRIKENYILSTEFVSETQPVQKESSYISSFNERLESLQNTYNNKTAASKSISDKYVKNTLFRLFFLENISHFLDINLENVKSIRLSLKTNIPKKKLFDVFLNEQLDFDRDGKLMKSTYEPIESKGEKQHVIFKYDEDGLLESTISQGRESEIKYNNDSMIIYDGDRYIVYKINRGILETTYMHPNEETFDFYETFTGFRGNVFVEDALSDDMNDEKFEINSIEQFFPIKYSLTDRYQSVFKKEGNIISEIYNNKKKVKEITYNSKNQIEKIMLSDPDEADNPKENQHVTYDFSYTYY